MRIELLRAAHPPYCGGTSTIICSVDALPPFCGAGPASLCWTTRAPDDGPGTSSSGKGSFCGRGAAWPSSVSAFSARSGPGRRSAPAELCELVREWAIVAPWKGDRGCCGGYGSKMALLEKGAYALGLVVDCQSVPVVEG